LVFKESYLGVYQIISMPTGQNKSCISERKKDNIATTPSDIP